MARIIHLTVLTRLKRKPGITMPTEPHCKGTNTMVIRFNEFLLHLLCHKCITCDAICKNLL